LTISALQALIQLRDKSKLTCLHWPDICYSTRDETLPSPAVADSYWPATCTAASPYGTAIGLVQKNVGLHDARRHGSHSFEQFFSCSLGAFAMPNSSDQMPRERTLSMQNSSESSHPRYSSPVLSS